MKNTAIALGLIAISSIAFGQKKIETSAAVEYKNNYMPAMMKGNMEAAKKSLMAAKAYIDEAAAHPDTKESAKTLYLKGEIYSASLQYAMMSQDTSIISEFGPDAFEVAIASYKASYDSSNKYHYDIKESVNMKLGMLSPMSYALYEKEQYPEAAELYFAQYQLSTAKGELDSISLYYSAICQEKAGKHVKAGEAYEILAEAGYKGAYSYALAGSMYNKAKEYNRATTVLNAGREKYGLDKDLLLELVKLNIAKGDNQGAEKALNDAISKDPNNKQLHFIIGTIYTDLGENEKAETALNKALELDPNYLDAQYNLGAHLVTWGSTLKDEANQMDITDPRLRETQDKSEAIFKRALVPLENYIKAQPEDAAVLRILYQLYHNLGDSEKALEYKKRYEAAK